MKVKGREQGRDRAFQRGAEGIRWTGPELDQKSGKSGWKGGGIRTNQGGPRVQRP